MFWICVRDKWITNKTVIESRLMKSDSRALPWFACLLFLITTVVSPNTALTYPYDVYLHPLAERLGLCDTFGSISGLGSFTEICIAANAVLFFVYFRGACQSHDITIISCDRFVRVVALLAVLYGIDLLRLYYNHSKVDDLGWLFPVFATFCIVSLFVHCNNQQLMVRWLVIVASVESVYTVAYYILRKNVFYTPGFGPRACGTFDSPNALYPVLLLCAPMAICCALSADRLASRTFYFFCSVVIICALLLTFNRSAWLGASSSLICLLGIRKRLTLSRSFSFALGITAFMVLIGSLVVRNTGGVIGDQHDRSAQGRIQIWHVALKVVQTHPIIGTGTGTYYFAQRSCMSKRLLSYNPHNADAKNLLLNLAAEYGLLGLAVCSVAAYSYAQVYWHAMARWKNQSPMLVNLYGAHAGFISLGVAGIFDTPIIQSGQSAATWVVALLLGIVVNTVKSLPKVELNNAKRIEEAVVREHQI